MSSLRHRVLWPRIAASRTTLHSAKLYAFFSYKLFFQCFWDFDVLLYNCIDPFCIVLLDIHYSQRLTLYFLFPSLAGTSGYKQMCLQLTYYWQSQALHVYYKLHNITKVIWADLPFVAKSTKNENHLTCRTSLAKHPLKNSAPVFSFIVV